MTIQQDKMKKFACLHHVVVMLNKSRAVAGKPREAV